MAKKKILIIGGGGFIGKWLIKSFSLNGWETSIYDPNIEKSYFKTFELNHIFNYSINDNELLSNALKAEGWNVIICLAAWGGDGNGLLKAANQDFNKAIEVNVRGFANLLDKLKNLNNIKFLWSSSTVVYGEEKTYSQNPAVFFSYLFYPRLFLVHSLHSSINRPRPLRPLKPVPDKP